MVVLFWRIEVAPLSKLAPCCRLPGGNKASEARAPFVSLSVRHLLRLLFPASSRAGLRRWPSPVARSARPTIFPTRRSCQWTPFGLYQQLSKPGSESVISGPSHFRLVDWHV